MSQGRASQDLRDAAADLDAMRCNVDLTGDNPAEEQARQAWVIARRRFLAACAAYVEADG